MRTGFIQSGPKSNRGISIVETLIGLTLSLIIIAVMGGTYLSNKRTFRTTSQVARVQENARTSMEIMMTDLRMAGYMGCNSDMRNLLDTSDPGYSPELFDPTRAISGWEFNGTGPGESYTVTSQDPATASASDWASESGAALDGALDGLVVPGTDVIVVKRLNGPIVATPANNNNINNNNLGLNQNSNVAQDTIVLVTNCKGGDLFMNVSNDNATTMSKGGAGGHTPGNATGPAYKWRNKWQSTDEIYLLSSSAYFIGIGVNGIPSLFALSYDQGISGLGNPVELVEGVESMQVLSGEDLDADGIADRFLPLDEVTDATQVVAARITFMFRTIEETVETVDSTSRFDMTNGIAIQPSATPAAESTTVDPLDDQHIRYVTGSTIHLRNRVL